MATRRRSQRITTTTIEIVHENDSTPVKQEEKEKDRPPLSPLKNKVNSVKKTTSFKKTTPKTKRPPRRAQTERKPNRKIEFLDTWSRAMAKDEALAKYIAERERLDAMIDETELSIVVDDNKERLNTTI